MYVLSVQYSYAVVSVFLFGGKANLVLLTLFYSTLLAFTHRQKDRRRNEYTCFAWAGGTFFPVVLLCCVSFWFWWEIGFDLHTHVGTQSTIQLWCCARFLVAAGNSFWCYVHTQCTMYSCAVVSVFWLLWEIVRISSI